MNPCASDCQLKLQGWSRTQKYYVRNVFVKNAGLFVFSAPRGVAAKVRLGKWNL